MSQLSPGTVIDGRYTIVDVFGVGGYATVYKAIQSNIDRVVAIKIFEPHRSNLDVDDEFEANLERFKREAKAIGRINHPNVVMVFDVGEHLPNQPFIVMQPFEGQDLSIHLRDHGPLAPEVFIPLFVDCLDGLAHAHELGIVHRDLKPENLVLCHERRCDILKVIDFGIVHLDTENVGLTHAGRRVGTPRYFSPEYVRDKTITPALDVYQLGIILVESLTARRVVKPTNPMDAIMVHLGGNLELPRQLLHGPLKEVLVHAMALDHRQRYANAGEMRDALLEVDPSQVHVGDVADLVPLKSVNVSPRRVSNAPPPPVSRSIRPMVPTGATVKPTSDKAPDKAPLFRIFRKPNPK